MIGKHQEHPHEFHLLVCKIMNLLEYPGGLLGLNESAKVSFKQEEDQLFKILGFLHMQDSLFSTNFRYNVYGSWVDGK